MGLRANPTYRQRRFGAEVRKLRERAGLSVAEAAALIGMQAPHLSNVEGGRTSLSEERLRTLAQATSGTSTTYVDALVELGQRSGKGWWSDYRRMLGAAHLDLAELESASIALHTYEPMFIPGLLQTREYATVIHRDAYVDLSPEWKRQAVEFRMQRQDLLTSNRPPRLHAIIHEAALRPSLGSPEVMRGQLLKLIEMSRRPEVTIQILPFDGRAGFGTGFTVIQPQVCELSTAVVSHIERSLYLEDENSMAKYRDWFAKLGAVALPPVDAVASTEARKSKDSLGLIQRLLYPLL